MEEGQALKAMRQAIARVRMPGEREAPPEEIWGSAVCVKEDETSFFFLSASHVTGLDESISPEVILDDGLIVSGALVVSHDPEAPDASLIWIRKTDLAGNLIIPVSLASPAELTEGQVQGMVQLFGYPSDGGPLQLSQGPILGSLQSPIRVEAQIPSGFSGGPAMHQGKLIGIVTGSSPEGLALVTPIHVIMEAFHLDLAIGDSR